jgi:DNA-binding NtrC family response regulator
VTALVRDSGKSRDRSTEIRGFGDGSMPLCLLVIAKGVVTSHVLPDAGQVTIGRADACDVRIDDASISRKHATLHVGGARDSAPPRTPRRRGPPLFIEDLGSANGTFLRGPRAVPPAMRARPVLDGSDPPPPSVRPEEAAVQLAPGHKTPISVGDFIDLGSTLLVVWPSEEVEKRDERGPGSTQPGVIIRDEAMRRLHEIIARIAVGNISVILLGETGVGKEVLAEAIHRRSPRVNRPFVGLNCAAFSETLLESELFGHEKGAFTGAVQAKSGLLETADGGTVFLDEVGELPLTLQGKLLRVLEEREVLRVGGLRPRPIDVRFIAATNRDLEADVARGLFRQDLYYRLNGISLVVPPLRERLAELPELARLFVTDAAKKNGIPRAPTISDEAMALMERYRWPGNIRELRNVVDRAVLLCGGTSILPEHLPAQRMAHALESSPSSLTTPPPAFIPLDKTGSVPSSGKLKTDVEAFERQRIIDALEKCGGNQTRAAKMLGISRRTLTNRLGQYDLPRPRKR